MRQIAVRVRYLPSDSACESVKRDGAPDWRLEHELLDGIRLVSMAKGGVANPQPHPARPKFEPPKTPERYAAEMRHRAKAADRRRRKAARHEKTDPRREG